MYTPGGVLALCLCCILSGNVLGYEYGEDDQDSYYNSIPDGEARPTQTPCQSQDLKRWDKLFTTLENREMKENMLLQHSEDMAGQMDAIRKELKLTSNTNKACVQAIENTCRCINEQTNVKLAQAVKHLREVADKHQAQSNDKLEQLVQFVRNQAARLTKLEGVGLAMKAFPSYPKEQEASSVDSGKLERTLQMIHMQLAGFQRATAQRYLPAGCDMAILFPMRSKHTFAEVTPSTSFSPRSLTICLWAKVMRALNRTVLFSYGTKTNPHELQLLVAKRSLLLTVGGETHLVEADGMVTDGEWAHVCATWSSEQGLASLWMDGEKVASVPGIAQGHVLPGDGCALLGQELPRSGSLKDLDSSVAFAGKMTGVNAWGHVLEAERIKGYANPDGSCDGLGDVIGWGVSEITPRGGVQYVN